MAKTKFMKKSITTTLNPYHRHSQFHHLFTPTRNPQLSFAPSTLLFFTLLLVSILCLSSIHPFLISPSMSTVSIITHTTATYSPLLLASLSSVYRDPSTDDDDDGDTSSVSLSTTAMVPLPSRAVAGTASEFWKQPDGEGFTPCLHFSLKYRRRSRKIANEKRRFLVVVISGGNLFQIRNQIVDAVVIARILEAALVLPVLKGDESEFSEVFDVEHFKKTLKADVRVVSFLPSTHLVSWHSLENQIPHNVAPFWIRARFFKKLNEEGSLVLTGLDSKLSKNLPPDLQKLRCKVAFHALKFTKPVRGLGNRIARRMWIEGPYIAIHLTALGPEYDTTKSNSSFPLQSLEAASLLKELGAPADSSLYIAGGEAFVDDRAILPLKEEFVNVVTKELLARDGEISSYRNRSTILTAIDYIVSLSSDVFLPFYNDDMARALQGHRAYVGHRKLITTSMNFKGQPLPRAKRRIQDVLAFPVPECMCKQ